MSFFIETVYAGYSFFFTRDRWNFFCSKEKQGEKEQTENKVVRRIRDSVCTIKRHFVSKFLFDFCFFLRAYFKKEKKTTNAPVPSALPFRVMTTLC